MKIFLQFAQWVIHISVGLLVLGLVSLQVYKVGLRYATRIETPAGVSSLEEVTLGGIKQWIFV